MTALEGVTSAHRRASLASFAVAALAALLATGCDSSPPLYDWNGYEASVAAACHDFDGVELNTHLERYAEQVAASESAGRHAPPGVHAHLAYLYSLAGDAAATDRELQRERELFPESAQLVDRLRARVHP